MKKMDHHCPRKTTEATKSVVRRCKITIRQLVGGIRYRVSGGGIQEIKGFRPNGIAEQVRADLDRLVERHSKEMSF